jgi:hypothetical protein
VGWPLRQSCVRARIGLAAGRAFLLVFAFLEVGFALGEAVGDAAGEDSSAFSAGEGDALGVGVATVGVSIAAGVATVGVPIAVGQFWRADLLARIWEIPITIAAASERTPTPIAQRASRWVRRCSASACLRSSSLRNSVSRSDAAMISVGESVELD